MDYFTALLDSYSKLKKRKLKLVEQGEVNQDERIKKASQIFAGALGNATQGPGKNQMQGVVGKASFLVNIKSQGLWSVSVNNQWAAYNPSDKMLVQGSSPKQFQGVITAILGDKDQSAGKGTPEQTANVDSPQQLDPMGQPMMIDPAVAEIDNIFAKMANSVTKAAKNLNKSLYDAWSRAGRHPFVSYFIGNQGHAIQQLLKGVKRVALVDGMAVTVDAPLDNSIQYAVAKQIEKLIEISNKDESEVTTEDIGELHKFALRSDGGVVVETGVDGDGVVFNDRQGTLKLVLESIQKKIKGDLKFNYRKVSLYTSDNKNISQIQGYIREYAGLVLDYLVHRKKTGQSIAELESLVKGYSNYIKQLQDAQVGWSLIKDTQAMTTEELDILDAIDFNLKNNGKEIMKKLVNFQKASRNRGADIRINFGTQVGGGERADVLEGYRNPEKARSALSKLGFGDEEINKVLETTTLDDLLAANKIKPEQYSAYKSLYNVDGAEPLTIVAISMKAYSNLDKITAGSLSHNSMSDYIKGTDEIKREFLQSGMSVISNSLGRIDNSDVENGIRSIQDNQDKIYDLTKGITAEDVDVIYRDKKSSTNSAYRIADSVLDILKSGNVISDLFPDKDGIKTLTTELREIAQKLSEESYEGIGELNLAKKGHRDILVEQLKVKLNSYLKQKSLMSQQNKIEEALKKNPRDVEALRDRENLRSYMATKLWLSCGCKRDVLLVADELSTGKSYSINQNKVVKNVIESVMRGDGEWEMVMDQNKTRFIHKATGQTMTMVDSSHKSKKTGSLSATTEVHFARNVLESNNMRGGAYGTPTGMGLPNNNSSVEVESKPKIREELLEEFIELQRTLLNKLINI